MLMFVQVFFIYIKCVVQDKKTYSYTKFRLRMSQTNNQEEQQHATILLRLNRISLLFVIHCINIFSHNPTPTEKKKKKPEVLLSYLSQMIPLFFLHLSKQVASCSTNTVRSSLDLLNAPSVYCRVGMTESRSDLERPHDHSRKVREGSRQSAAQRWETIIGAIVGRLLLM